jgi:two-component system LytT family response regulator
MTGPTPIRTLIVDDEPLARAAIRNMLTRHAEIQIVGECSSGAEAILVIESLSPNLVFLDVQMPEVDGFGVVEAIGAGQFPCLIFVTAYDQYAVRAFEIHTLDYLLKPFDQERFDAAVNRAKQHLSRKDSVDERRLRLRELVRESHGPHLQRFIIREPNRIFFLAAKDVDWIEAQGNYVSVHAGIHTYTLRESLGEIETQLAPGMFRRIHRSTIVNVDSIRELHPMFHGGYTVVLHDGTELKLSERFRENLRKDFLGKL